MEIPLKQTPPNSHERELMLELMILRNALYKHLDASKPRLKNVPGGLRDAGLLKSLVNRVQEALIQTLPDKYFNQYKEIARKGQLRIDLPGPVHAHTYSIVDVEDLATLAEAAMRDECAMCIREGKEARDCPLRLALIAVAPPPAVQTSFGVGCEYSEYSAALVRGEDVIV